jgi:hypothetical protein
MITGEITDMNCWADQSYYESVSTAEVVGACSAGGVDEVESDQKKSARLYRRMTGVCGKPRHHSVVLCGVDRSGRMATASGVDFDDARANVDRKFDQMESGAADAGALSWPGDPVRVNQWTAFEIARTAKISENLAVAVVQHRQEHGPFCCGPDIGNVQHEDREGLMRLAAVADYTVLSPQYDAPDAKAGGDAEAGPRGAQ